MLTEEGRLERQRAYRRKSYLKNREEEIRRVQEYRNRDMPTRIKALLNGARMRARKKGIEFKIGPEDLATPTHCPLLGIRLVYFWNTTQNRGSSPSIDRIDNSKGYVPGNVWIISERANSVKKDATADELGKLYRGLKKKLKEMDNANGA